MNIRWVIGSLVLGMMCIPAMLSADQFSAEIEAEIGGSQNSSSNGVKDEPAAEGEQNGFLSEEKLKRNEQNVPFWLALGPQVGIGPNILFPPKNASEVADTGVAPFEDGGGGIGGGGGGLISTRFVNGRFGVDLGLFAERNQTRTNMTVNGIDNNIFVYKYSVIRLPLLFKLYRLRENRRWSLGMGPELLVGLDSTKGEIQSDEVLQTVLRVEQQLDLAGSVTMGWAVKLNKWLLGIDLKITYNITGPREYDDRVTEASGGFEITGSHSLDARLLVNMMYEVGLGAY